MRNFLDLVLSFFPRTLKALAKAALCFVCILALLWSVLFALHLAVPTRIVAMWSPNAAVVKEEMFRSAAFALGMNDPGALAARSTGDGDFVYGLASYWSQTCLGPDSNDQDPRISRLGIATTIFVNEIGMKTVQAATSLDDVRTAAFRFAWTLILLGMATTIVSALNSSEFGSGAGHWASIIKITAIVLPALSTAITAYAALYAPTDLATRKAQLVSNLSSLSADISVALSEAPCPISKTEDVIALEKQMSAWRKRLSEVVSNANAPQSPVSGKVGQTDSGGEGAPPPRT